MPKVKIEFVYAGLRVRNLDRSLRFYRKLGYRIHRRGTMGHGAIPHEGNSSRRKATYNQRPSLRKHLQLSRPGPWVES